MNGHLTALDHFYEHLGLGPVRVRRDQLTRPPRSLGARQQKRYLRAAERRPSARDRAIAQLPFHTGLRISELVALDLGDVPLSARKGKVIVRAGKGGDSRDVPLLDPSAQAAVADWKTDRGSWPGATTPALFLNLRGGRLSTRAVSQLLADLAADGDLVDEAGKPAASAHDIRHTFATNLLRSGADVVVVSEILGHRQLDTTRLYTLPTPADIEAGRGRYGPCRARTGRSVLLAVLSLDSRSGN